MTAGNRMLRRIFGPLSRRQSTPRARSSATRTTGQQPNGSPPSQTVDGIAAVRGASTGFTVLLLGGMIAPLIAIAAPLLSMVWLPLIAISAFFIAASRTGDSSSPWMQGVMAAVGSYLLVLPLVLIDPSGRNPIQIGMTFVSAIFVGALAGHFRGRPQRRHKRV